MRRVSNDIALAIALAKTMGGGGVGALNVEAVKLDGEDVTDDWAAFFAGEEAET